MKLHEIPFGTPEEFKAVIEIEKDSNLKYEYDKKSNTFVLDFVFTNRLVFPYAYGFIPGTLGGDGDALDVFVISCRTLKQGEVAVARPIGMLDVLDRGVEDNKIIAVLCEHTQHGNINEISELDVKCEHDLKDFYAEVAIQKQKTILIRRITGSSDAINEIQRAHKEYMQMV